jgi:hypothetical protein
MIVCQHVAAQGDTGANSRAVGDRSRLMQLPSFMDHMKLKRQCDMW